MPKSKAWTEEQQKDLERIRNKTLAAFIDQHGQEAYAKAREDIQFRFMIEQLCIMNLALDKTITALLSGELARGGH